MNSIIRRMRLFFFKSLLLFPFIFFGTFTFSQSFEWVKTFGGSSYDQVTSMTQDTELNIYLSGWSGAAIDIDPGSGIFMTEYDAEAFTSMYLSKFTPDGEFTWGKNLDFQTDLMITDPQNNLYLFGMAYDTIDFDPGPNEALGISHGPNSQSDMFICKLDSDGNYLWHTILGSISHDYITSVGCNPDGSLIIAGTFEESCDFDPSENVFNLTPTGDGHTYILKLSSNGEFVWVKSLGNGLPSWPSSVHIDGTGNILISGQFKDTMDFDPGPAVYNLSGSGEIKSYVLKLNSLGEFIWVNRIQGTESNYAYSVVTDQFNNVYHYGGFLGSIYPIPDNNFWALIAPLNVQDAFLVKYNESGDYLGGKKFNVDGYIYPQRVQFDQDSNLLVSGSFNGTIDYHYNQTNVLTSTNSQSDIFVFKMNQNLQEIKAINFGGEETNYLYAFLVSPDGSFFAAGTFYGAGNFDPLVPSPLNNTGITDAFFTKYSLYEVGLTENTEAGFSLYPNPTSGKINLTLDKGTICELKLIDALGKEIESHTYTNISTLEYEIPGENGIYFLQMVSERENRTFKVIKR